jgi:hypothetical protein
MNRQILKYYIREYKINFERVSQQEIYKWKAVKCFQDNWDLEAENFSEMLLTSIDLTQNLLKSGQYFPLRMLTHYSRLKPQELKELFRDLYDEEQDIFERINNFQEGINNINTELFPGKKSYQDHRAIIVYLTLRYPERYFFYKFEMYKQLYGKLGLSYRPIRGHIENIAHFNSQAELIRYQLSLDQELLKLHKNRITEDCYYDENLNILTQDFIYAVARHLDQNTDINNVSNESEEFTETNSLATDLSTKIDQISFRGRTVNYIQKEIENKRIGDLGELWVIKYEIEKLKKAGKINLIDRIKHISKNEGDGTGYDVLSFDSEGNRIFIEVKTTKGAKNSTFYVTRNELEKSKIESENYYVYRLYNFNEKTNKANLFIINGDLTDLCSVPTTYKVQLTNECI